MSTRLRQVDGLRAIAALMVVAYHFTTRYDERFGHVAGGWPSFAFGSKGVELFFAISGFVIFMTLQRSARPMAFAWSRFTRLFPTFWAAVLLTWGVLYAAAIPGLERTLPELLGNLTMLPGALGIAPVDGAYWSLEVELLFYIAMLGITATSLTRGGLSWLVVWLLLSLAQAASARAGLAWPHAVVHGALLDWIGWFALGIVAARWAETLRLDRASLTAAGIALAGLGVRGGISELALACIVFGAVGLAAQGRLPWLQARWLVWFGAISYPLYLVHQAMGMALMVHLQRAGWGVLPSIAAAFGAVVACAALLHHAVENPSANRLRPWGERRWQLRAPAGRAAWRRAGWACGVAALALLVTSHLALRHQAQAARTEANRLAPVLKDPIATARPVDCPTPASRPVVLLALGQSNAASQLAAPPVDQALVWHAGRCWLTTDPLPNTSGSTASLWTAVAAELAPLGRPVMIVPYAVGGTRMAQWTQPGNLHDAFRAQLRALSDAAIQPTVILWQQGEADMARGTELRHYAQGLRELRALLDRHGMRAPLLAAKSSRCRVTSSGAIARAWEREVAGGRLERVLPGPDTDRHGTDFRSDRCHFNAAGRAAVARDWAASIGVVLGSAEGPLPNVAPSREAPLDQR